MTETNSSQYRIVSVGYVAENKDRTSKEVEVWLTENNPFLSGEVVGGYEEDSVETVDSNGKAIGFSVKLSNTVMATWKGDGSNRVSSPDVRRGEKVTIKQFGDADEYFWEPFNEPGQSVRRRETVVEAFSNTEDENDKELNPENSYFSEVNTHDGKVVLMRTNKKNGEKAAFDVSIDTKSGHLNISDDQGNGLNMDTGGSLVKLENSAGTKIHLNKGDIIIECSGKFSVKASNGAFDIPTTEWKGNIELTGNLGIMGNMLGKAGGTYTFNGDVITTAGLMNNGKDVGASHTHNDVEKGSSKSGKVS